jgi:hypothetical protein
VRRLTFKGFLESYVKYLSGEDTVDLTRLSSLLSDEPRLAEPLVLWAVVTGRGVRLAELLKKEPLASEVRAVEQLAEAGRLEKTLAAADPGLRPEYAKAWRSYVSRRDAASRDARLKLEARERVLALEAEKSVTRYRMAKALGLNPGNLSAFLVQGNASKLSVDKAFQLVRYLEAA